MLFETTLSGAGRASGQHVNALRRQLGFGNDAAPGGATASPKKPKAAGSRKPDEAASNEAPVAGLEQLRKALREAMGETEEPDQANVLRGDLQGDQDAALSPGQIRAKRERDRPSATFRAPSRAEKAKLDLEARFRAPPLGTYRPKSGQSRPRLLGQADFGKVAGRAPLPGYGGELAEGLPEKPPPRVPGCDFAKSAPRKAARVTCHVNSFTAGVLDGDLRCSDHMRPPCWDFSRSGDPQAKVETSYFQPGQYVAGSELGRPRMCLSFDKQPPRKPFLDGLPAGNHLPDRSLSRSCPVLSQSRAVVVPDISKYRPREPFYTPANDNHANSMTFDAMEASRFLWRRPTNVDSFDKSLDRKASLKGTRCYAQDIAMQIARHNETHGPASVELSADIPRLHRRVSGTDFDTMPGRTPEMQGRDPSARTRDQSRNMKFERGARPGEARTETSDLSPLVGRRQSYSFEAPALVE